MPHDLIKSKSCCFLLTGVSTESQKRTSVPQTKRAFFSNKKYDSYKCWNCAELCEAFTFLVGKYICAIWRHGLSINSGNSYRHKLCSTHIGFVFILLWEGFYVWPSQIETVWSDRGSSCKFRNARSAFRNLHVDPLSLHTFMRNKQVVFNPYIYTLTTLSKLYRFGYENIRFLIQNTQSLFYGRHYSSLHRLMSLHRKLNVKIFLSVYRSRKHWECKYFKYIVAPERRDFVSSD